MSTITIKAVPGRKRKDGTYPVRIRVTFARVSRFVQTTVTARATDLTRGGKIKNPVIIAQTNDLCDRLRAEAAKISPFELEGKDADWVVRRLKESMRQRDFRLDFFVWADEFLKTKSEGNRAKYLTALRAFERYLGKRECDVNAITHAMLVQFADYCDTGPKFAYSRHKGIVTTDKPRTGPISPHYLSHLSHIFEAAKDRYNDEDGGAVVIPRSPFRKLNMTPPKPKTAQKALPVEVIQSMITSPVDGKYRTALDVFLVGFALYGANMADLYEAAPPKGRWWAYDRRKTRNRRADHAHIVVDISWKIEPLLRRLGAGTDPAVWLPALHRMGSSASAAGKFVNTGLRWWCESRGIEPFTFYAGRHSWATLARRSTEKATVDEALGHVGEFRITDIYAERDWEQVAEANRRVLALFRWS